MTGVSGGQTYKIDIDQQHAFAFSIVSTTSSWHAHPLQAPKSRLTCCSRNQGFTNPWVGTYKAGIVASDDPKQGYEAASQDGGSVESPLYSAKDNDGHEIDFKLHISATASQHPAFVVSEIRY